MKYAFAVPDSCWAVPLEFRPVSIVRTESPESEIDSRTLTLPLALPAPFEIPPSTMLTSPLLANANGPVSSTFSRSSSSNWSTAPPDPTHKVFCARVSRSVMVMPAPAMAQNVMASSTDDAGITARCERWDMAFPPEPIQTDRCTVSKGNLEIHEEFTGMTRVTLQRCSDSACPMVRMMCDASG